MLEALIYRRPDHCLFAWKAVREEGRVFLVGQAKHGQPLISGYIEFFDSEQMAGLDHNGEVWLVSDEHAAPRHRPQPTYCTADILALIAGRRDQRNVPPLTQEQQAQLKKLVSKKR